METNSSLRAFQPRYQKVRLWIEDQLKQNAWKVGEKIPGEAVLARNLDVSTITVRQALNALADEGFLRREKGRGTFVARAWEGDSPKSFERFEAQKESFLKGHAVGLLIPLGIEMTQPKQKMLEAFEHSVSRKNGRTVLFQCPMDSVSAIKKWVASVSDLRAVALFEYEGVDFCKRVAPVLEEMDVPLIAADYLGPGCIPRVVEDLEWGMRLAVDHLVSLGHRKIALAKFERNTDFHDSYRWMVVRASSFLDACRYHALSVTSADIFVADQNVATEEGQFAAGRWAMSQICKAEASYTAVIGITDHVALGVLAESKNRALPLSVVGFDNIPAAAMENLTTVVKPSSDMGSAMVNLLEILVSCPVPLTDAYHQIVFRPRLICRQSSSPRR